MTLKGYLTDSETADQISAAVAHACDVRGVARYIGVRGMPVFSGPHAGAVFIPLPDSALQQVMWRGQTLADFPEFAQLVGMFGGLGARVEIDAADLVDPNVSKI
jgi:hypothetical protein